jgi:hypothetical protein
LQKIIEANRLFFLIVTRFAQDYVKYYIHGMLSFGKQVFNLLKLKTKKSPGCWLTFCIPDQRFGTISFAHPKELYDFVHII